MREYVLICLYAIAHYPPLPTVPSNRCAPRTGARPRGAEVPLTPRTGARPRSAEAGETEAHDRGSQGGSRQKEGGTAGGKAVGKTRAVRRRKNRRMRKSRRGRRRESSRRRRKCSRRRRRTSSSDFSSSPPSALLFLLLVSDPFSISYFIYKRNRPKAENFAIFLN